MNGGIVMTEREYARRLVDFIYASPTPFHAVDSVKKSLNRQGFLEIREEESWRLESGGKYYVTRNDSAIAAFIVGQGACEECGFKIIAAHTDSPGFRIKPAPEMTAEGDYVKLNTEVYGGPILSTWLDRPLAVAGRVALQSDNVLQPETRLVNINKPVLIIPNLAIHMNRDVNKGVELNRQKDVLPLMAQVSESLEKGKYLLNAVARELGVEASRILDFDLFLYEYEKGGLAGLNEEYISCGRLDDLAMVHAGAEEIGRAHV